MSRPSYAAATRRQHQHLEQDSERLARALVLASLGRAAVPEAVQAEVDRRALHMTRVAAMESVYADLIAGRWRQ